MNFQQFRAKVFTLFTMNELDKKTDTTEIIQGLVKELKQEFGKIELEGIKLFATFL